MADWKFTPDAIEAAREIAVGDRVTVHWSEAECQDQLATVIGVQIEGYGRPSYAVMIDGDISPTDGFYHDPSGHDGGTISLHSRYKAVLPAPAVGGLEVVRYSWLVPVGGSGRIPCVREDGDWVKHEALSTLFTQVQRLTEENEALRKALKPFADKYEECRPNGDDVRKGLALDLDKSPDDELAMIFPRLGHLRAARALSSTESHGK